MNTTKKLIVLCLAAIMAIFSLMPATFSWYSHNADLPDDEFYYSKESLPVSGTNNLTANTVLADKNGKVLNSTPVTEVNFSSNDTIKYYKTTLTNSGGSDAYAELDVGDFKSSTSVKLGIYDPVINEKGFEITKSTDTWGYKRIYFQPTYEYGFWYGVPWDGRSSLCKLRYTAGNDTEDLTMTECTGVPSSYKDACSKHSNRQAKIYYADIPGNATSLFFYNSRYYDDDDANKNWNRTEDITDLEPCTLYKLNGTAYDQSYKKYVKETIHNAISLNQYYESANLGINDYVQLGLKNPDESEGEEGSFTPDYSGESISYSVSDTNKATVDKNGNLRAIASTDNSYVKLTTKITGEFGDELSKTTKIYIKDTIAQMPVAQNVLVKAGKSVDLYWYVKNTGGFTGDLAKSIFYTV